MRETSISLCWTCMLTLPGKVSSSTATQPTSCRSRCRFACFPRYYRWTARYLNTRGATSLRRTCTARTSTIMFQNRGQEEWPSSKPLRIPTRGLSSAITIWAESSTSSTNPGKKRKHSPSPTKRNWTTTLLLIISTRTSRNPRSFTRSSSFGGLARKFASPSLI